MMDEREKEKLSLTRWLPTQINIERLSALEYYDYLNKMYGH